MKKFDKITNAKLFQNKKGLILLCVFTLVIGGACIFAKVAAQDSKEKLSSENTVAVKEENVKKNEPKASKKDTEKSSTKEANDNKDASKPTNNSNPSKKPSSSNKVWVEPVYKTIEHPAVTREEEFTLYKCMCGKVFASTGDWQAHRPVPCNGKHSNFSTIKETRTVVVKQAWTEKVLVKEGYWK